MNHHEDFSVLRLVMMRGSETLVALIGMTSIISSISHSLGLVFQVYLCTLILRTVLFLCWYWFYNTSWYPQHSQLVSFINQSNTSTKYLSSTGTHHASVTSVSVISGLIFLTKNHIEITKDWHSWEPSCSPKMTRRGPWPRLPPFCSC